MEKRNKILYWIATLWLSLGMISTGIVQLMQGKEGSGGALVIEQLGYPLYILKILGIWKLLGVVAVLIPKFPLLKEWAYAGFFFMMSSAVVSHIAFGDSASGAAPSVLLLVLTIASWYFRPSSRKVVSLHK